MKSAFLCTKSGIADISLYEVEVFFCGLSCNMNVSLRCRCQMHMIMSRRKIYSWKFNGTRKRARLNVNRAMRTFNSDHKEVIVLHYFYVNFRN